METNSIDDEILIHNFFKENEDVKGQVEFIRGKFEIEKD